MAKVYITGDIHGSIEVMRRFASRNFTFGKTLTKDDIVIVAGDFGILWDNEPSNEENYNIEWLKKCSWTTAFVDGNHENHPRLQALPREKKWGSEVGVVAEGIYHLRRGNIYDILGSKIFCFGGALSWDKARRLEGVSWWPEEIPSHSEMEYGLDNLEKNNNEVDYVITHTAPNTVIKITGLKGDKKDATTDYLEHVATTASFKGWFNGHMHVDMNIGKFRQIYHDIIEMETGKIVNKGV